jgi:PAS domain S-box-containing protein
LDKSNIKLVAKLGVIASTLSSITDLKTLSKSVNRIVDSIVNVKYNGFYLLDEYTGKLKLFYAKGFNEEEKKKAEETAMDRHPGWVFKKKEILLISDTEQDKKGKSKDSTRSFVVRSRVWLPILCHNKSVGAFGLASLKPDQFSEEHISLITFVCELSGVVYNNITLRSKQARLNLNLKKSKNEFEILFESNPDAILIHDFESITNINTSFLELFNYKFKEEVINKKNYSFFIVKECYEKHKKKLENRELKNTIYIPKISLKNKDKEVFSAEVHISSTQLNGNPHIQFTIRDITKRITIEEQLKKEEQKSLMMRQAEQVPGIIYQSKVTESGKVSYPFVSGRMIGILDDSMNVFDNIYDEDYIMFTKSIHESGKTLKDWSLDYRIQLKNKNIRWMRGNSKPVLMPDKSVIWHGYISDITEHKEAEKALSDRERQLSTMYKHAPEAIIILDTKNQIQRWNPKAEEIFGWSSDEVYKKDIYELILPEKNKKSNTETIKILGLKQTEGKHLKIFELTGIQKNGKELPIAISKSGMLIKDHQYNIIFIRDITKQRKNEQEIQQSLDEKDVLLKEIHHRVKNNMQVITGLLSLQSDFVEKEPIRALFLSSQRRIHSMGIVHEMLYQSEDVSKIHFRVYLKQLTEGLIRAMKGGKNNIELNIDCPELSLNLDTAIPLGLITNELITNSLKHGIIKDKSGQINIKLTPQKYPDFKLEIGDNGSGFNEKFDYRTSKSLGLMLVHKLTKQLSGKIVRDFSKEGSNFVLYFQEIQ